jgi:hypothetical protein
VFRCEDRVCGRVSTREYISNSREISVKSREIKSHSRENILYFREIKISKSILYSALGEITLLNTARFKQFCIFFCNIHWKLNRNRRPTPLL